VPQHSTFIEEMMAAGRGVLGLFVGNRQSGSYFDFSQRGLIGSFIALLLVTVLNASMPTIMGAEGDSITRALIIAGMLFALQLGCAALALRQLNRLDGFVPYLVADNWTTFFVSLLMVAVIAAGLGSQFTTIVLGIVVIVIQVNIGRLVVTLPPLQIAMFLVAQMVGLTIGLVLVGFILPVPPDAIVPAA